jgi:hypothetical protein
MDGWKVKKLKERKEGEKKREEEINSIDSPSHTQKEAGHEDRCLLQSLQAGQLLLSPSPDDGCFCETAGQEQGEREREREKINY